MVFIAQDPAKAAVQDNACIHRHWRPPAAYAMLISSPWSGRTIHCPHHRISWTLETTPQGSYAAIGQYSAACGLGLHRIPKIAPEGQEH